MFCGKDLTVQLGSAYGWTQIDSGFVAVGIIPDSSLGSSWIVRVDGFGNPIR
jgi:hypothetical protein